MSAPALDLLARSTLLLLLLAASARAVAAAGGSAAMRHAIWHLGFTGLAALPLLAWVLPPLSLAILPSAPVALPPAASPDLAAAGASAVLEKGNALDPVMIGVALYGLVAAFVLCRHLIGRILIHRLWRDCDPADADSRAMLEAVKTTLGIRRPVLFRIARRRLVPMTWGSFRPRILLPAEAHRWPATRMRAVLLHELGHIARFDGPTRLLADAVCAAYWVHPGVWIAARHLRLAQEQACDDLVLASERDGAAYARVLLDCAGSTRTGAAMAMACRTDLERRLRAILGNGSRRRAGTPFVIAGSAVMLATTSLAASIVAVPSAPAAPVAPHSPEIAERIAPTASTILATPGASAAIEPRPGKAAMAPPRVGTTQRVSSLMPSPTDSHSTADAQFQRQLEDYRARHNAFLIRMAEHRLAKAKYRSDYAEYRRRLAEHRDEPWTPVPIPPVAPVAPPAPTMPVAPPVPPTPPTPPTPPDTSHA